MRLVISKNGKRYLSTVSKSGKRRNRELFKKTCLFCEINYETTKSDAKYCSLDCYKEMTEEKNNKLFETSHYKTNAPDKEVVLYTNTGYKFTVFNSDLESILRFTWTKDKAGYLTTMVSIGNKRRCLKLHRFLLGLSDPKTICDHVNGKPWDNTISNLRIVSKSQNFRNSISNKIDAGVRVTKSGKYSACATRDGKNYWLGTFKTKNEAIKARAKFIDKIDGAYSIRSRENAI